MLRPPVQQQHLAVRVETQEHISVPARRGARQARSSLAWHTHTQQTVQQEQYPVQHPAGRFFRHRDRAMARLDSAHVVPASRQRRQAEAQRRCGEIVRHSWVVPCRAGMAAAAALGLLPRRHGAPGTSTTIRWARGWAGGTQRLGARRNESRRDGNGMQRDGETGRQSRTKPQTQKQTKRGQGKWKGRKAQTHTPLIKSQTQRPTKKRSRHHERTNSSHQTTSSPLLPCFPSLHLAH